MTSFVLESFKVWYVFTLSIGFYTCLNLIKVRNGDKKIHLTLMIFVGILLVPIINAYLQTILNTPLKVFSILSQNLTWAYGPLLFLVIKHTLLEEVSGRLLAVHFAPLVLANMYRGLDLPLQGQPPYFHQVLFAQTFGYCAYSIYLVVRNKSRLFLLIKHHPNTTYYWLLFLSVSLLGLCLYDVVLINIVMRGHPIDVVWLAAIAGAISVYVNVITLFALYQPTVIFKHRAIVSNTKPNHNHVAETKNRNVELTPTRAQALNEKLNTLVKTDKPHLDETLTLAKLASLLGVTRNQLSEFLNVYIDKSFYEYLNNLRFQEATKLLVRTDTEFTIGDIAYQAGFNNRNSFYKVFKEKTGLTPSEYKRQKKATEVALVSL